MSYARGGIVFKSLSLALFAVGCSAGEPSSPEFDEGAVGQNESELLGRRVCAGPRGSECKGKQYCAGLAIGQCPSKAVHGVCTPRPSICPQVISPVCGCDGLTYSNSCIAAAAGAAVAKRGECEPKPVFCGGIAGFPCPDGQTCVDNPNDECDPNNGGADCGGICITRTNPCAAVLCKVGTQCIDRGGVAVCVPLDPCAVVRCKAGTACVNQGGVAACVPSEPCGNATCVAPLVCCNPLFSICRKPGGVCIF